MQGAFVDGTVVSGAATTLGKTVEIVGNVKSGAATTLGADSHVYGTVMPGAALTLGSGATIGKRARVVDTTLTSYPTYVDPQTAEIEQLENAQLYLGLLTPNFETFTRNIGADETWVAGVHQVTGAMSVSPSVIITLDAEGSDADFIINVSSYLSFGADVKVKMINLPGTTTAADGTTTENPNYSEFNQPRVIWNITGTYISLGANTEIEGTLMAKTYVSTGANSVAKGGVYAATQYVGTGEGATIGGPVKP